MDGRKRNSGASYRNKRKKRFVEQNKLKNSLRAFLLDNETDVSNDNEIGMDVTTNNNDKVDVGGDNETIEDTGDDDDLENTITGDVISVDDVDSEVDSQLSETAQLDDVAIRKFDFDDPACWPDTLTGSELKKILAVGPKQLTQHNFPKTSDSRGFSEGLYFRNLSNGEKIKRTWLVYSKTNDSVHCYCCSLFDSNYSAISSNKGIKEYKNIHRALSEHEITKKRVKSYASWKERLQRAETHSDVDILLDKGIERERNYWREVLKRLVLITKYLARQCIAFRGSSSKLFESNNGNFLKLVETIAEFDPIMSEHLSNYTKSVRNQAHYMSSDIQNEIISILGTSVRNEILYCVRKSKYFSIIVDCTPNISHMEQTSIILRYVSFDEEKKIFSIREDFLEFIEAKDKTGEGITNLVIAEIKENNLNLDDIRGQGYDNGSNMK